MTQSHALNVSAKLRTCSFNISVSLLAAGEGFEPPAS